MGATVDFLNIDEDGQPIVDEERQAPLIDINDEVELFILDSHRPINLVKYGSHKFIK